MSLKTEWTRYGTKSEHLAYSAWQERARSPIPALIVIQEAWGVDGHIEDLVVRFARAGYMAFAPDLFSEDGERPTALSRPRMEAAKSFVNSLPPSARGDPKARDEALSKLPEPQRSEVGETVRSLFGSALTQTDHYLAKLLAAASLLRTVHPVSRGAKVGSVGFCMGGALSALLACADPELSAAVMFYGSAPTDDQVSVLSCPVLAFYGGLDTRINAGIASLVLSTEKHRKRFEHHLYEGAQHAFFNDTRPSYDVAATRDAFARTLAFLGRELG